MQTARHVATLLLAFLIACSRGPARDDALRAIRRAHPELDTASVTGRVWQDGPPWFSCAEVVAKAASRTDTAAVRDQVGNWKPLVAKGWITLRDTASGPVSDPGWCTLTITDAGRPRIARWTPALGPVQPTLQPRRGWVVAVGHRRINVIAPPTLLASDSATADFFVTVATNEDGEAVGAGGDTARYVADLRRDDGTWHVVAIHAAQARAASAR